MKNRIRLAVSLAVTAFFLWLALHGVKWSEVWTHVRHANWIYLALSALVLTLSIHMRALRWKPLLAPVDPHVRLQPRVAGTAVGFAANNLIPARVGEIVRAVVCGLLARLPVSSVLASLVVERVLDGVVTVTLLLVVMALPGFPSPERAGWVLTGVKAVAAVMLVIALVIVTLALMPGRSVALAERIGGRVLPARLHRRAVEMLESFIHGLAVLRNPRLMAVSVAWAFAQWLFIPLAIWFGFLAFDIRQPGFLGAVFLQCAINLAVAIPSSPGFFGPLEAAATLGLSLWGVDKAQAVSLAIGYHLGGFITVTALGLYYVQKLDLSWRELIGRAERADDAAEAEAMNEAEERREALDAERTRG
jgi:uncharacterized protein (TIRG00374 family)